ncbi:MAG: hypothetical protein H0T46_12495 [Deltaproteobacteria bacterium]|nr:hypothetical protein [Deltaproteobacteria bacterium]
MRITSLLTPLLVLAACGEDNLDLATPDHCNPLGGVRCATPFPSSIYEVDDATTATGRRVAIAKGALPTNIDGVAIEPDQWNTLDGFSSAAPMVIAFESGIDGANLVHFSNYEASITAASPTVLIDLETGELLPHFAELDVRAVDTPASQALYIRPSKLLAGSHRYAVAIKKTLKAKGGGELVVPEGFQALVDGEKTTHPLLEKVRSRYTEIFAALAAKGIQKEDLVTAWDFTTRSRETVRADLLNARDAALPLMGAMGASLTYTSTTMTPGDARFAARYDGEYDAPMFLNQKQPGPGVKLLRDDAGKPKPNGLYKVPFTAIVPQCALTATAPVPILIYGHGLLGDAQQTASSGTRNAAAEGCYVAIGTDMRGMSDVDVPNVALALNDVNNGNLIFDVLIQGMVNHVALVQIARGPMANTLFAKPGGGSLVDPTKVYFYGISQGGIMGTTVCALDPVITRCVLQVGAINYSVLLERSRDWPTYRTTLNGAYPDSLDNVLIINLMQNQWDRTEATSLVDTMVNHSLPGTPQKQVFMQVAIADDEVANVASEMQARTMGIPVITPSPYIPYGLQAASGPVPNGMLLYDFGLGHTIPKGNEAPPDNSTHSGIRNKKATTDMIKRFLDTGEIVQMCTAPKGCDCAANGCGVEL